MSFSILGAFLSHLLGTRPAEEIEKEIEKRDATVLAPLDAVATSALNAEASSLLDHNKAFAAQEFGRGLDLMNVNGPDRPLLEALLVNSLGNIHLTIGSSGAAASTQGVLVPPTDASRTWSVPVPRNDYNSNDYNSNTTPEAVPRFSPPERATGT